MEEFLESKCEDLDFGPFIKCYKPMNEQRSFMKCSIIGLLDILIRHKDLEIYSNSWGNFRYDMKYALNLPRSFENKFNGLEALKNLEEILSLPKFEDIKKLYCFLNSDKNIEILAYTLREILINYFMQNKTKLEGKFIYNVDYLKLFFFRYKVSLCLINQKGELQDLIDIEHNTHARVIYLYHYNLDQEEDNFILLFHEKFLKYTKSLCELKFKHPFYQTIDLKDILWTHKNSYSNEVSNTKNEEQEEPIKENQISSKTSDTKYDLNTIYETKDEQTIATEMIITDENSSQEKETKRTHEITFEGELDKSYNQIEDKYSYQEHDKILQQESDEKHINELNEGSQISPLLNGARLVEDSNDCLNEVDKSKPFGDSLAILIKDKDSCHKNKKEIPKNLFEALTHTLLQVNLSSEEKEKIYRLSEMACLKSKNLELLYKIPESTTSKPSVREFIHEKISRCEKCEVDKNCSIICSSHNLCLDCRSQEFQKEPYSQCPTCSKPLTLNELTFINSLTM